MSESKRQNTPMFVTADPQVDDRPTAWIEIDARGEATYWVGASQEDRRNLPPELREASCQVSREVYMAVCATIQIVSLHDAIRALGETIDGGRQVSVAEAIEAASRSRD